MKLVAALLGKDELQIHSIGNLLPFIWFGFMTSRLLGSDAIWETNRFGGDAIWVTNLFGGAVIWVTNLFGGDAKWVKYLFGGDAIWETSSTRKPNFGAIFRVENGFKWKFQLSFSDQ